MNEATVRHPARPRRGLGVRALLVLLVLLALLPAWGAAGFAAWRFAEMERARLVRGGEEMAREIAAAVEREIAALRGSLSVLASSPAVLAADAEAFSRQAAVLQASLGVELSLVPAERDAAPPALRVSDLRRDPETGRPVVVFRQPVDGAAGAPLDLLLSTDGIGFWSAVLERLRLPPGWVASVLDGSHTILARVPLPARFVGQQVHPDALAALREAGWPPAGWRTSTTRDGVPVHMAWRQVSGMPWTVLVGVPRDAVDGALRRAMAPVVLGGLPLLLALTLGIAFWGDRRLVRPLRGLQAVARVAGRGEVPVPLRASGVREVDAVATTLVAAARSRRARQAESARLAARLQAVLDHVPVGVVLAEAPSGRIILANRRAARMLGVPEMAAAGVADYARYQAFDGEGRLVPAEARPLARALAGESPASAELRMRRPGGDSVWIRAQAAAIRDDEGRIAFAVAALMDIDAERQAAEALRQSELRFRILAEAVPQIVWSSGPDGRVDYLNPRFFEFTGQPPREAPEAVRVPVHPEDRAAVLSAWRAALQRGEPYEAECRMRRADGAWRWFVARALPARGADGVIRRWIGSATDVTDLVETRQALERQVAAEAAARAAAVAAAGALAASETRFRRFAEASPDVLWVLDAGADRLDYVSPAYARLWGAPPGPGAGHTALARGAEEPGQTAEALRRMLSGEAMDLEYAIRRPDGQRRWIRVLGFPIGEPEERPALLGGFVRDITARREAEQRQRLLIGELNHRVKNTLATVLSLARQTARRAGPGPVEGFLADFQDRLMALARGHDLLTARTWRGATLEEVAASALAPWRGAGDGGAQTRIRLEGPPVWLAPRQALALALAIHEMATNAAKHGALSLPTGQVVLTWRREEEGWVDLAWEEGGGPPARPPERQGFGTRLLRSGLPNELGQGATVTLDYRTSGFRARIRFRPAPGGETE
ncbi:PAS domain S-box protein [Crenalkalicoccus roseus]|uniref:PAS domain S-box protein n=1 Tax=Crenalkalicoccus roseus TaxID=1485588 RepID=UPI001081DA82|nr:PAS domain S-box protein [Crenalkalicoccus roseus]